MGLGTFVLNGCFFLAALALWWAGNIWYGNLAALDSLAFTAHMHWSVQWSLAILPSLGQAWFEDEWARQRRQKKKGQQGQGEEEEDRATTFGLALIATVLDLGGPMLGFFVVTGWPVNAFSVVVAGAWALLCSWWCQHVWMARGRILWRQVERWVAKGDGARRAIKKEPVRVYQFGERQAASPEEPRQQRASTVASGGGTKGG